MIYYIHHNIVDKHLLLTLLTYLYLFNEVFVFLQCHLCVISTLPSDILYHIINQRKDMFAYCQQRKDFLRARKVIYNELEFKYDYV